MFGRLLNARIKTAEAALRDDRLDEAFRLAMSPDIRDHRRGKAMLGTLADQLVRRAREHFAEERFTEALLDIDKAEAAGAPEDKINELRAQVRVVAEEVRRQERSRQGRLDAARKRIERGSLDAGRRLLQDAGHDDAEAEKLARNAEKRDHRAGELVAEARNFLAHGREAHAIERIRRAKAIDPHDADLIVIEREICDRVLERAAKSLDAGRTTSAARELTTLADLGDHHPMRREVDELLQLIRRAADALQAWHIDEARQDVLRLQNLHPGVQWIEQAARDLAVIDEKIMALKAGPLGETLDLGRPRRPAAEGRPAPPKAESPALAETVDLRRPGTGSDRAPDRLLLIVEGGGSYLLHRGERMTVGRAMTDDPADIPLMSDLAERHADIARTEEDYFVFSPRDMRVNGAPTRQALLADGDRVVLGRKAKFTFRMPSRRSPSAVLDMSDGTKIPNDVRRVILFSGHALIGHGSTVHARCGTATRNLVLYERKGQLWLRPEGPGGGTGAIGVPTGESVELEGVRLVVKPWPSDGTGLAQR